MNAPAVPSPPRWVNPTVPDDVERVILRTRALCNRAAFHLDSDSPEAATLERLWQTARGALHAFEATEGTLERVRETWSELAAFAEQHQPDASSEGGR